MTMKWFVAAVCLISFGVLWIIDSHGLTTSPDVLPQMLIQRKTNSSHPDVSMLLQDLERTMSILRQDLERTKEALAFSEKANRDLLAALKTARLAVQVAAEGKTTSTKRVASRRADPPLQKPRRGSLKNGGVLIFLHVPKTGGKSLGDTISLSPLLDWHWGEGAVEDIDKAVHSPESSVGRNTVFGASLHVFTTLDLGHKLREWRNLAASNGIPFFVLSMVREPVSMAVSHFEYMCIWSRPDLDMCGVWSHKDTEESLRATAIRDPQLAFYINKFRQHGDQKLEDIPTETDLAQTWEALISNVDWIGRTEAYGDTKHVLEEVLGRELNWQHSHKNTGHALSAKNLTDVTMGLLQGMTVLDQELYNRIEASYRLENLWED